MAEEQAKAIRMKPGERLIWLWRHKERKYVFRVMPPEVA